MLILNQNNRKALLVIAKVWSVLIVLIYLTILLGHLFGEEEIGSDLWANEDIIAGILLFLIVPVGFAWSWFKNELVGAWLSIAGLVGFFVIIAVPRGALRMTPMLLLIGGPAILYLIYGYSTRKKK